MLGALIIVFREMLEAGLIIGVVLAATKGIPHRGRWVSLGVALGVAGACLVAFFAGFISQLFHGSGQELFNASVLFCAVAMLAWHNIWMSTHGREMARDARELGAQVSRGSKKLGAVATVVAIAVLREGSEVVLFLYGLLASSHADGGGLQSVLLGGAFGILLGGASTAVIYFGLLAIPVRHFFTATTVLITFLAAGLAAQGASFLQQGGYLENWSAPLWNTSGFLPENEWIGRLLHTLIGYSDQPSGLQAAFYVFTLCAIAGLMFFVSHGNSNSKTAKTVAVK
jgi:high-affinity iron transporter